MTPRSEPLAAVAAQPWLDELFDALDGGVALIDSTGRIIRANERLAGLAGRGRPDGQLVSELFRDAAWDLALAAARQRGRWRGRLPAGGRELIATVRIGAAGYGVLICHDRTAELARERRTASLEAQIAEQSHRAESARELLFEQAERLTTVHRLSYDAVGSGTVRDTAARAVEALIGDLGAESVSVWLLEPDPPRLRRLAGAGSRAGGLPESCDYRSAGPVAEALRLGRPLPDAGEGALAGLAVFPLPGRDGPLGLLAVDVAPDLDTVQLYTPHLAAALSNAMMAEQLALANAELRQLDQQKTEFLNVVAHDLRTPLTCIRTYTDLIAMYVDEPPETYAEFLQIVVEETERLGQLLDNFLDLARLENATLRFELGPVRVDELIERFGHVWSAKAAAEQIELWSQVERDLPAICADRPRLEQVITNLLSNAFKHTPPGGQIGLRAKAADGGVTVWVEDTGPGVPEADRARIFERFRQARGADRSRGGAGLGLAIAHAVVTAHGGRIWVEDVAGGGASFGFWLPLEPPDDAAVREEEDA